MFKGYGTVHEPKSYGDNRRWDMINIPVFHATDDESNRPGGGDWVHFVPITSVWTTERNNYLSNRGSENKFLKFQFDRYKLSFNRLSTTFQNRRKSSCIPKILETLSMQ